ncbi:hypothetical protein GUITHDRAFT_116223 [Guillardia theta CCMP2712]|uniref:Uncharacterized protein n=1 Tax=Guillardia theta (strain CCMP2712) TaxID=905079 RepID=L1INB2_GUITC|nr:hypothetical protein GUITHDRAFT_116223 [Guillardia theta CCMP2712]EKX37582.1 hypothetical protein GUITHDRAFT_116223 [Guillardia theta CCMP2712]|eukprot:XP_005824562.1 hypothetical protein GUITHDRAFT_116223 [Guillardia theta CCMP2712]
MLVSSERRFLPSTKSSRSSGSSSMASCSSLGAAHVPGTLPSPHSLDVHCSRSLRAQKHPLATFFVEAHWHDFVHNAGAILYRRVRAPAPYRLQMDAPRHLWYTSLVCALSSTRLMSTSFLPLRSEMHTVHSEKLHKHTQNTSSSSDFVESPEGESSPEVSDSDGGHTSSGPDDRRGAGEASPSLTVTSGASGELDTTGVLAAGPSSPASSPASVGSRRALGIAAASPPSRAVLVSATADSEASEEDYLERYRVPVSSLPPSAAPGGPPGSAGSLSAAALSPSAAARFVAAADVSTDSGQSAASAAHPDLRLEFARFKRELPHSRGGDEFTPSEGLHPAVYYTAIARFLAWYSDQPMSRTLPSPHSLDVHCSRSLRAQKHPLATFFVEAHDFVHNAGAILYRRVKAPAPAADGAAIPPAPAAVPDDAGRLVDSSHEHFIPPPAQRNVTPLVMRVFPRHVHARAALTDQQRDILTLHSRRTHSLKSQDRVLQSTIFAHFPERDLSHSAMRVSSYYPLKAFPHRYAQMLDCYLHHGMPICQCPTECDGCQRELDPSVAAHHLQTCKRRSSKLPTAHDNLTRTIRSMLNEAGLQSVIDTVGDPRSRRQVPSHPHGRKMKGDIHIPGIRDRGSEQYEGLMADVTLVHPYIGSSADLTKWGEVNLDALHVAASEKIRKHRAAYAMTTPPRAFIPLAISTDGTLHPDTLRFIWYLADIIAQRSMPLEDAAFGRHFVPDDGPAAEVLARKRAATYQRLTMQLTLEALLSGARRMTPLRAQALASRARGQLLLGLCRVARGVFAGGLRLRWGKPFEWPRRSARSWRGVRSPSLTVTSGASGELDTTGVLQCAAGPSSPASSPASVGSRRALGIAAASPPSRAATTDSATADSEASEEDYLERYRVPVSSLPPSAAPGGPPGSAGSLSAAALSPSAAARFVAAADVSTDSGQSAASGYRV